MLLALGEQTERVADLDAAVARRRPMLRPVTGCAGAACASLDRFCPSVAIIPPSWYRSYERPSRSRQAFCSAGCSPARPAGLSTIGNWWCWRWADVGGAGDSGVRLSIPEGIALGMILHVH